MDDLKVQELRILHRDLARFLGEQYKSVEGMSVIVAALRKTMEGDPNLVAKYRANLQSLKDAASAKKAPQSSAENAASGFLNRLSSW